MRKDLTYEAWLELCGRRAYTCEGDGFDDCPARSVGHFYDDEHASANGWDVSDLPMCPECVLACYGDVVPYLFDSYEMAR